MGRMDMETLNPKRKKRAVPRQKRPTSSFPKQSPLVKTPSTNHLKRRSRSFFICLTMRYSPFNSDPRFAANYKDSGKPKNARAYTTLIEGIDKSLGDLMDHVAGKGEAENTLILFVGDNGSDAPLGPVHGYSSSVPLRGKKRPTTRRYACTLHCGLG